MKSTYIALGYECNNQCITCPLTTFDRIHKSFSYEDIIHSIGSGGLKSNDHVTISGGEPTLNKDFLRIVKHLTCLDVHITILSNAVQFANKELVEQLRSIVDISKCNVVSAIHSSNDVIHDKITGTNGSFRQTLQGINNLISYGIPVSIKHIINRMNYMELDSFAEFLTDNFPSQVEIEFCVMDYAGRAGKNLDLLLIDLQSIGQYLEKALDIFESKEKNPMRKISIIETPCCMVDPYYWKYLKITSDILGMYIAPNSETKNNVSYGVENQCNTSYSECGKCRAKDFCAGVWRSTYNILGNQCLKPYL